VDFWTNGYTFYFELAGQIAAGRGLAVPTAFQVSIYPMFLAAVSFGRKAFLPIVLAQSLIGAATDLCGALLTTDWFGAQPGIVAAALAAAYPYYFVHDTALQETGLFAFLTLLSLLLLIRARWSKSPGLASLAVWRPRQHF